MEWIVLQPPYDEVGVYTMDGASTMYGSMQQHMNHTSVSTAYHHPVSAATSVMSTVSDLHKRDKEILYGYVKGSQFDYYAHKSLSRRLVTHFENYSR